jgi:hypothetical protein
VRRTGEKRSTMQCQNIHSRLTTIEFLANHLRRRGDAALGHRSALAALAGGRINVIASEGSTRVISQSRHR